MKLYAPILLVALLLMGAYCQITSFKLPDGRAINPRSAQEDLNKSNFRLLIYGELPPDVPEWTEWLEIHHVEELRIAGCEIDDGLIRAIESYNEVVAKELDLLFGHSWHNLASQVGLNFE